ncbi:CRISPR-associated protein, Csy3 family [Nitrosococcus halophilus Nc 4]|uniref:CRISPR-associated protein, Csy3 family n=1 Tax=Nitrosococcus halophilus (strain Nc4) TaxID=472759 RepID=D5BZR5_NITHN|nr:type I-F CRISPR-associated protein Csy3 [Nitrosococcus halophilus]ADE14360.1 CRISPR-associated protein, Csy3 family [Nitrosococcus halophilus Nc 4]
MASVQIPPLLNYTRSIIPSEGTFWVSNEANRPLLIQDKTVLGTIANYSSVYKKDKQRDEEAINKEMMAGANNIQRVDSCHLPADADTFEFRFTLKFLDNAKAPEACDDPAFREDLEDIAQAYAEKGGFTILAERYLANLLNGRFLWRNRYGTQRQITLRAPYNNLEATFEVTDHPEPALPQERMDKFKPWIDHIAGALSGEVPFFLIEVSAKVTIGLGQEVYPSQEFVDSGSRGQGKKSKTLFSVQVADQQVAAMHSQKIGNAIRTIDNWYPDASADRPLAVDPFTVDKRQARTVRLPDREKSDFYSLLKNLFDLKEGVERALDAKAIPGHAHYFMAVLIRGGVFSGEKKTK